MKLGDVMLSETPAGVVGKAEKKSTATFVPSSFNIEIADNGGFTVSCCYKSTSTKRDAPGQYKEPTRSVFGNKEDLFEYLGKVLKKED
jgi:hypothetical protein